MSKWLGLCWEKEGSVFYESTHSALRSLCYYHGDCTGPIAMGSTGAIYTAVFPFAL